MPAHFHMKLTTNSKAHQSHKEEAENVAHQESFAITIHESPNNNEAISQKNADKLHSLSACCCPCPKKLCVIL
jgi:hypothetical protein